MSRYDRSAHARMVNPKRRLGATEPAQFRAGLVVVHARTMERLKVTGRGWNGTTWRYSARPVDGGELRRYDEDELVLAR